MTATPGPVTLKGELLFVPEGTLLDDAVSFGQVEISVGITPLVTTTATAEPSPRQRKGRPAYGHPDAPAFPSTQEAGWPYNVQLRQLGDGEKLWGIWDADRQLFAPLSGDRKVAEGQERAMWRLEGEGIDPTSAVESWQPGWLEVFQATKEQTELPRHTYIESVRHGITVNTRALHSEEPLYVVRSGVSVATHRPTWGVYHELTEQFAPADSREQAQARIDTLGEMAHNPTVRLAGPDWRWTHASHWRLDDDEPDGGMDPTERYQLQARGIRDNAAHAWVVFDLQENRLARGFEDRKEADIACRALQAGHQVTLLHGWEPRSVLPWKFDAEEAQRRDAADAKPSYVVMYRGREADQRMFPGIYDETTRRFYSCASADSAEAIRDAWERGEAMNGVSAASASWNDPDAWPITES